MFTVKDGEQIFLAAVSDQQWAVFCKAVGLDALLADPRLASNTDRVQARDWMMPLLRAHLAGRSAAELSAVFEAHNLPCAPIVRAEALFDDPHLNATGGLAPVRMNDGSAARVPLMPFTLGGQRPGIRLQLPLLGEHTAELLRALGYDDAAIAGFQAAQGAASNA